MSGWVIFSTFIRRLIVEEKTVDEATVVKPNMASDKMIVHKSETEFLLWNIHKEISNKKRGILFVNSLVEFFFW